MVWRRPLGSVSWTRSPTARGPRRPAGPSGRSAGAAGCEVTVDESTTPPPSRAPAGSGGLGLVAAARPFARLRGLDLAVLRRGRRHEGVEELLGGGGHVRDRVVERLLVGLRRLRHARDLAHVLE